MAKKKVHKKTNSRKGLRYGCSVCGLSVTVDNVCGCVETHPIACCGQEMKRRK